jgi:ribonuclease J
LLEVKFQEFGIKGVPINTIAPGDTLHLGGFKIETFPMSHSMPGDIGLIIHTPLGKMVHIADFKFDRQGDSQNMISILQRLGAQGVLALFTDSTNAEEEGKSISETVVEEAIDTIFARTRGRIIVTSFASAVPRIQSVINACLKHGRRLAIAGHSMERNVEMTKRLGYLKVPQGILVNIRKMHSLPDDKIAIMCTGSQGEEFSALSRIAGGEHRQISIKPGDTIVISGSVIPGHERSIADTVNNLFRLGADVIYGGEGADIHTSGHAKREDLKLMLKITKPKYFIPIHGEYRHLVLHARLGQEMGVKPGNIFVLENGQVLEISKEGAKILKARVPSGYVLVDGLGVGDVGNIVLRDRQAMAKEGILVAIMTIDHDTGKLITSPDIISRGFIYMREQEELVFKIRQEVKRLLAHYSEQHHGDMNVIKGKIRDDIGQFIYNEIQRRPMVIPVVIQV